MGKGCNVDWDGKMLLGNNNIDESNTGPVYALMTIDDVSARQDANVLTMC